MPDDSLLARLAGLFSRQPQDKLWIEGVSEGPPPGPVMRAQTMKEQLRDLITGEKYERDPNLLNMLGAMIPDLLEPGAGAAKAALPLDFLTRHKKFYHGSQNKFTKFREGPIDPESPVMPSPGAVYFNPDVRMPAGSEQYPGWPNVYEAKLHDINNVLDMGEIAGMEKGVLNRYGQEGMDRYLREQEANWKLVEDLYEEGVFPAPEMRKRGIDAIRYASGWGENPRGWNIAVTDPDKASIIQVLNDLVLQRVRKMHSPP